MNNSWAYIAGFLAVLAVAFAGIAADNILAALAVLCGLSAIIIVVGAGVDLVCETLSGKQTETNQPTVKTEQP